MKAMNTTFSSRPASPVHGQAQRGLSLIELMVAITIGMLVVAALLALFVNVTRTNNEMSKANRQIENGRFAIQILQGDLQHAGFWGRLGYSMPPAPSFPAPTAIPDPCVVSGWDAATRQNLVAMPVQGYADGGALGACGIGGVLASSDVLVVRHANTCTTGTAGCDGGDDTGPQIQVSACQAGSPPPEAQYVLDSSADSAAFALTQKDCATTAPLRKFVSNIYYLATSQGQPTLMRASLSNGAYTVQPLIEGIEAMRFEYGLDTLGRNGLPTSPTNPPDGSADTYVSCAPCDLSQLANVVAVKVHLLARNLEPTPGYTDSKAYRLGEATAIDAANDPYKRHVFSTTVRLVNVSGRREQP
jgi:type IV pilus assembly protein PilW